MQFFDSASKARLEIYRSEPLRHRAGAFQAHPFLAGTVPLRSAHFANRLRVRDTAADKSRRWPLANRLRFLFLVSGIGARSYTKLLTLYATPIATKHSTSPDVQVIIFQHAA